MLIIIIQPNYNLLLPPTCSSLFASLSMLICRSRAEGPPSLSDPAASGNIHGLGTKKGLSRPLSSEAGAPNRSQISLQIII